MEGRSVMVEGAISGEEEELSAWMGGISGLEESLVEGRHI